MTPAQCEARARRNLTGDTRGHNRTIGACVVLTAGLVAAVATWQSPTATRHTATIGGTPVPAGLHCVEDNDIRLTPAGVVCVDGGR